MLSQVGALESGPVSRCHSLGVKQLTLKVRHVGPGIRVQGIDDHLTVRRTGDLDAAIDQARGRGRAPPGVVLADMFGLGQEVEQVATVNLGLALDAALQQGLAGAIEGAVQQGQEGDGLLGEDLAGLVADGAEDGDVFELRVDRRHVVSLSIDVNLSISVKCFLLAV